MIKLLNKNTFTKNIAVLMTGSVVGQAILFLSAPILSRMYEPSAFGLFALYVSISTILSVISALRYELAIVIPKKDDEAVNILSMSVIIVIGMTLVSFITVFFLGDSLSQWLDMPLLSTVLWWIPVTIFAKGLYQSLTYWSTRRESYKRLSISQFFRSSGTVGGQLLAGLVRYNHMGLIVGQLFGQFFATIILVIQVFRDDWKYIKDKINTYTMKKVFFQHIDFLKYSTPQAFLNAFSQNVPPLLLAYYFNSGVVGFYALCLRILLLPFNLVSESVRRVFFQRAASLYNNKGNVFLFFVKSTLGLGAIGILPILVLILFGPTLFSLVLGSQWEEAGHFAQWISVWLFFGFVSPPASVLSQIYGLQKQLLMYEVILLILRAGALVIGGLAENPNMSIMLFSLVGAVFNLLLVVSIGVYVKRVNEPQISRS